MDEKIKELLAVLNMPEDVVENYLLETGQMDSVESLADLAFRLRDEVKSLEHYPQFQARLKVYNYVRRNVPQRCDINHIDEHWWAMEAKPIYWIIAALIAKSLGVTK